MAEKKWTDEQLQAITERGRNILVSAGAGSGKTAVMVERATRLILEDHVPVSGMLIVTFTNAAATEMRERLRQALKERLGDAVASGDQDEIQWIRKQLDDLHGAQISTFHAFAQRVIKEFFPLIDIEPGARVLDEAETEVFKEEALDELFDAEYEERNDDFIAFLDTYSGEKTDSAARQMILDLYRKLEVVPDGLAVLDEKIGELELDADGFERTHAYEELVKLCRKGFDGAVETATAAESLLREEKLDRLADMVEEDSAAITEAAGYLDETQEDLDGLHEEDAASVDEPRRIDEMAAAVRRIQFARMAAKKDEKESYALIKDMVKALRDDYKARVKDVLGLCYADLETMTKVLNMTAPLARALARLVRRFDELFRGVKNDHKGIDYSDMEHFAYEILGHREAAEYYRELFRYIFIDEYQDTNYMQETIVSMIARPDNLFMVGDIKQSIYHFRLADPEIFQNKYDEYKEGMAAAGSAPGSSTPIKIDLNRNFRSKEPVIREINNMFRPLMDGYDKDAELICGIEQSEHALPCPKTYIVDRQAAESDDEGAAEPADAEKTPADEELADMKKEEIEARAAVQIIRENLGKQFSDPRSGEVREVKYRDIVILMRSFKRSAEGYRKEFQKAGIPLYIDDRSGYFDTIEINVALALLSVINNKRQDVPFIALLRSEIFGFSCGELAMIRKLHRYGSYVEAAEYAAGDQAEVPEKLRKKCRHVFDQIKKWQTYAMTLPLSDMIWRILNETGYYIIVGTFPGGAARQANLRLLADRAQGYSERSLGSLYGFIRYIDTLKKNQVEMPQASLLSENENVVRIMTIHHSKGLEFPVVILAGMDNQPKGGESSEVDFDRKTGLGLKARDPKRHLKESSLIQRIIAAKEKQAETDELRRVFYVAVTRARETFYLLGASDHERIIAGLDAGQHSDSTLLRMSRYLPEIVHVTGADLLSKPLSPVDGKSSEAGAAEPQKLETAADGRAVNEAAADERVHDGRRDAPSDEEVIARLDYEYPYAAAGELAAKTSVTGLNQAKMRAVAVTRTEEGNEDSGQLLTPDIPGMDEIDLIPGDAAGQGGIEGTAGAGSHEAEGRFGDIVPGFISGKQRVTAARTGTVYHKMMEKLDFTRAEKEGYVYIAGVAAELVSSGIYTEEEVKTVDLGKIEAFFRTDIGKRCTAAAAASMLNKEQTFESKIKVAGEDVLVQGVIDCWFEEEGEEVLIDYKTNRIDPAKSLAEEKARIRETYQTQLDLYADAIEKATGRHVKEKYLYLFAINEAIQV